MYMVGSERCCLLFLAYKCESSHFFLIYLYPEQAENCCDTCMKQYVSGSHRSLRQQSICYQCSNCKMIIVVFNAASIQVDATSK